jgi:hypothetical protein
MVKVVGTLPPNGNVKLAAVIDERKRTTGYVFPPILTLPVENSKSTPMLGFNDVPGKIGTPSSQKLVGG